MSLEKVIVKNSGSQIENVITSEKMIELSAQIAKEAEEIKITNKDRNNKGELLVFPSGPVSNLAKQSELWWKMVRTKSFRDFFGDWQNDTGSKIVDSNGEPLAVFRGFREVVSFESFYDKTFYIEKALTISDQDPGVFFSPLPEVAFGYAEGDEDKGNVMPAFVNARKIKNSESFLPKVYRSVRHVIIRLPKGILKIIPQYLLDDYDGTFFNGSNPNEADEISVNSPFQVLIIPNSINKYEYKRFDNNTKLRPIQK